MSSIDETMLTFFPETSGLQANLHSKLTVPDLFLSSEMGNFIGWSLALPVILFMVNLNTHVFYYNFKEPCVVKEAVTLKPGIHL